MLFNMIYHEFKFTLQGHRKDFQSGEALSLRSEIYTQVNSEYFPKEVED